MVFSTGTYKHRLKKALKVAASQKLDGLILTRPSSIFYIPGFIHAPTSERPLYAILPQDGDPILLTPQIEYGHAESKSWIKDIRRWYFDQPSTEQPFKKLANILEEIGLSGKRIGVEDPTVIPTLQKEMPKTAIMNTRWLVRDLRMLKSKEEIELIKKYSEFADFALNIVNESIEEGVSELELVGKAINETLLKFVREVDETDGPIPIHIRVTSGSRTAFPHAFSTTRKIRKKDPLLVFASFNVYGYECGEIARTMFFGKPSEKQKKIYNTVEKAMELSLTRLKPGVKCNEVHKINYEYLKNSGYKEYIGIKTGALRGLESRDGITISETDETIIKSSMTFWMDSGICIPGKYGLRFGNLVLVTEDANIPITKWGSDLDSITIET
jgi:Xaa-Pro dipeptidase